MVAARISVPISPSRKRPHKGGGAAPKSGAAVAARLLRRNRPTEAVPARPSGRNRAGTGQEPGRNRAGTGRWAGTGPFSHAWADTRARIPRQQMRPRRMLQRKAHPLGGLSYVLSVIPGVLRFEVEKYIVPKQRFWDI